MRIVSLLPSATEILFAIGLGDQVVAITHECDYPEEAVSRPVITECVFDSKTATAQQIDSEVRALAREGKSLYRIKDDLLRDLRPDLIVTQELCDVCAVTPDEVNRAIRGIDPQPQVVSLNPKIIDDVFNDMFLLARLTGIDAMPVIDGLQKRVRQIAPAFTLSDKPTVACIEWLNPLWRTGHWVPGMVELAGGIEVLAESGKPSRGLSWEELKAKDPDVVILMPCGYSLTRTRDEFETVRHTFPWSALKAFVAGRIYIVDANSYFSRSGPRLVEGVELLAEIFHPEYFKGMADRIAKYEIQIVN
jgi:ABC-type Fe3+-hydroxamate transport system, periplasmic component